MCVPKSDLFNNYSDGATRLGVAAKNLESGESLRSPMDGRMRVFS